MPSKPIILSSNMARNQWISAAALYIQGALLFAIGMFILVAPEEFLAGTGDLIEGKPVQLLHSMR